MASSVKGKEIIANHKNGITSIETLVGGACGEDIGIYSDATNMGKKRTVKGVNGKPNKVSRDVLTSVRAGKDLHGDARTEDVRMAWISTHGTPTDVWNAVAKTAYANGAKGKPANMERCPVLGHSVVVKENRAKNEDGTWVKITKTEIEAGRQILLTYDKNAQAKIEKAAQKFIVVKAGKSDAAVKREAEAKAAQDAKSDEQTALETFLKDEGKESKHAILVTLNGAKTPLKLTRDEAKAWGKAMGLKGGLKTASKVHGFAIVVCTKSITANNAWHKKADPLMKAANKSKPATAGTAEKSQKDPQPQPKPVKQAS